MYYFLSDTHLGLLTVNDPKEHQQKVIDWLDYASKDAKAIYLLGDIFDFWFEFKSVVPGGFDHLFGKIKEIIAKGIEVHFFIGNHDLWTWGYLENEIGMIVHKKAETINIEGKKFFLAHGDGIGNESIVFSFLRAIFHSKLLQLLFRAFIPPQYAYKMGLKWSASNRKKHNEMGLVFNEDKEVLVKFSNKHSSKADVDYYIFGHRHYYYNSLLRNRKSRIIILGESIESICGIRFDGKEITNI